MMFQEICDFIALRTGFIKGSTLQVGHRPQSAPNRCVLIAETAGGSTVPECPDMAMFQIQALSRAKTYLEARADIWEVYLAIHGTAGWNMPHWTGSGEGYLAMTVDALAIPQYIGQDENGRYEFSVNFIFRMEIASCGT